jgi:hypothetical protein
LGRLGEVWIGKSPFSEYQEHELTPITERGIHQGADARCTEIHGIAFQSYGRYPCSKPSGYPTYIFYQQAGYDNLIFGTAIPGVGGKDGVIFDKAYKPQGSKMDVHLREKL